MITIGIQQIVLLFGILLLTWRFLRPYVTRSPLDNVPGPPSASILKGMCFATLIDLRKPVCIGNILQLFNPEDAWDFHKAIGRQYGSVIRFTEMFGVSTHVAKKCCQITQAYSQKRALYVFDPKALHSIVVKEQYVYERASFQTGYMYRNRRV